MKLKDAFIYVVGTISVLLIGLIIVGGVAFFMVNRIEFATANHAQRETERIAEMGEAQEPDGMKMYEDTEFIIEDLEINRLNNGTLKWRTTKTHTGDYQSGTITFYVVGDNVSLNRQDSDFPSFIDYRDEMNEAIENEMAVQNE